MELNPFDVICVKGKTEISRIIERSTDSLYSHCLLIFDKIHVIETDLFKPLNLYHFSYRLGEFDAFRLKIPPTEEQKRLMYTFIQKNLNAKYDIKEALSYYTYKYFGFTIGDPHEFICSGAIYEIFKAGKMLIVDKKGIVNPGQVAGSKLFYQINSNNESGADLCLSWK